MGSMSIFHVSITFTTDHSYYSKNCSEVSPFLCMEIFLQKCCKQWRHQFVWPTTQLKNQVPRIQNSCFWLTSDHITTPNLYVSPIFFPSSPHFHSVFYLAKAKLWPSFLRLP